MINHALLVRQFACFETAQAYVTVMELIDGVEVRDVTRAVGGLPVNMNKLIVGQLCLGLRYLHHIGFIHRDVKVRYKKRLFMVMLWLYSNNNNNNNWS